MREMWFIFDNLGNVFNDGDGTPDFEAAKNDFINRFGSAENAAGFTLCKVLEDGGCWVECLEEIAPDDIF